MKDRMGEGESEKSKNRKAMRRSPRQAPQCPRVVRQEGKPEVDSRAADSTEPLKLDAQGDSGIVPENTIAPANMRIGGAPTELPGNPLVAAALAGDSRAYQQFHEAILSVRPARGPRGKCAHMQHFADARSQLQLDILTRRDWWLERFLNARCLMKFSYCVIDRRARSLRRKEVRGWECILRDLGCWDDNRMEPRHFDRPQLAGRYRVREYSHGRCDASLGLAETLYERNFAHVGPGAPTRLTGAFGRGLLGDLCGVTRFLVGVGKTKRRRGAVITLDELDRVEEAFRRPLRDVCERACWIPREIVSIGGETIAEFADAVLENVACLSPRVQGEHQQALRELRFERCRLGELLRAA